MYVGVAYVMVGRYDKTMRKIGMKKGLVYDGLAEYLTD
ncbi:hypothetical protein EGR_01991 [Echinococcus granulosus]|uniref:Uncharacterized protein n=1 Tax=Echinococcus granulosus TaxID=6210 RepID=W6UXB7_ECHGR|nr:hypothetical protein EGR_01991 [Echinococcus granulosus]EUB63187.1 hypothetical protein EGR_01991 [Echinococcus granulosus]